MNVWPENSYFNTDDPPELVYAGLERLVGELGLDYYCLRLIKWPHDVEFNFKAIGNSNFPQEWIDRYMERGYYYQDPIRSYALQTSRPFYWGPGRFLRQFRKSQQKIAFEARAYGIVCGLAFPVHSAQGIASIVNFVASGPMCLKEGLLKERCRLLGIAFDVHDFLLGRTRNPVQAGRYCANSSGYGLSPKEKECLYWTTQGKSAKEISEIVGLSIHSVNRYASIVAQKLGCANKYHAAIKAMRDGLL